MLCEAARLFIDRAIATVPAFSVTNENAYAVAQVCQRLDGMPLAIELAAARVKVLAVEQIATRLDDQFRLLTGGSRMVPRQQTLRAAIDWSYQLLSEAERTLLRRLSVFAGGWTLEAAEAVCAGGNIEGPAILDLLTSLVDKSLILAETQRGEARYRFLEMVRQYAHDRLMEEEEDSDVRCLHRDWCADLAERAAEELQGPGQGVWLERLEAEHDNLRVALEWSKLQGNGADASLRMAGALAWFWRYHGHWEEGRRWLEEAIDRAGDTFSRPLARALRGAANLAFRQGDYARTTAWSERGLDGCRQIGDKEDAPYFLTWLGIVAQVSLGDYERARVLWEESLTLARALGDKWLISLVLTHLGYVASARGDDEQAAALADESYILAKEIGDKWLLARVARDEGFIALCLGSRERALMFFRENITFGKEVGSTRAFDYALEGLAQLACEQGHYDRAARLLGAVERLGETEFRYGTPHVNPRRQAMRNQHVSSIRAALGESSFAAAWAEGRAMTLEQAIEYALQSEG